VPHREAQVGQVSALVAQVSQVLERAARDAQEITRVELENRVPPPELRHQIVIILRTPARKAPPRVLLFPIVTIPSTRVPRVQPPALPLLTAISRSTRVQAA
jgi:hypothetical protein